MLFVFRGTRLLQVILALVTLIMGVSCVLYLSAFQEEQAILSAIIAIVLGGVSLAGGRGGVFGPIVAVIILQLIRSDMTFLNVNTNLATVANGVILIGVVMFGSLIQMRRARA